jgi:hypothetical protein
MVCIIDLNFNSMIETGLIVIETQYGISRNEGVALTQLKRIYIVERNRCGFGYVRQLNKSADLHKLAQCLIEFNHIEGPPVRYVNEKSHSWIRERMEDI